MNEEHSLHRHRTTATALGLLELSYSDDSTVWVVAVGYRVYEQVWKIPRSLR